MGSMNRVGFVHVCGIVRVFLVDLFFCCMIVACVGVELICSIFFEFCMCSCLCLLFSICLSHLFRILCGGKGGRAKKVFAPMVSFYGLCCVFWCAERRFGGPCFQESVSRRWVVCVPMRGLSPSSSYGAWIVLGIVVVMFR